MYDTLFQPLAIGPRQAKNRLIFGSHTTNFGRQNLLSQQHAEYYEARARGGAGMIMLEEHIVHPSDMPYEYALTGYAPGTPAAIARVSERIHTHGALCIVQLNHNGQQSSSDHTQRAMWAPSAVPDVASREVPKAMEKRDIAAVIEGFALVARHAAQGQADGIELQVADRSLLRQFLSPLTNQRDDSYGGALDNRLRCLQETIEAVEAAMSSDMILGVRLCADELAPWAGLTPEQGIEIARLLAGTGRVDYLTITMGSIYSSHMFPFHASMHIPRGYAVHLAASVKAAISSLSSISSKSATIPIFAAGRIMHAEQAEHILSEGQADGVEMIRALIADPDLPRLSRAGNAEQVRPCIACNQGCQVRNVMNAALACSVNPDVMGNNAGSDAGYDAGRDADARPYMVIGGGPGGLEAARALAQRGKRVVLYERERILGGAVVLAAQAPGRQELGLIVEYLQREIEKMGVEVHLGSEMTAEMVLKEQPEAVIVATGARSSTGLLTIPGHDLPHVIDVRRVLRGEQVSGQRVVVLDETASHGVLSVAELLASQGRSVEIVTEDWYVGRDLAATGDIVPWMQRALAMGVVLTTHTSVVRIEAGQVVVSDRFAAGERGIAADAVVLGVYERPAQELYLALKGRVPRLYRVGDCVAPRRIEQAILEGRQVGGQS